MERKNGETFEFEGKKLKVVENNDNSGCKKCFFCNRECSSIRDVRGFCSEELRTDKKYVIFVEVNDEQPQEQAEQPKDEQPQLNLCEILKDCPKGTKLYSPAFGEETYFVGISSCQDDVKPIIIRVGYEEGDIYCLSSNGHLYADNYGECCIFPSKEMRDWSKFSAPWLKKERFNPKTLKAFDRVLVKDEYSEIWSCDLFSHLDNEESYKYFTISTCWNYCIPYNDDTKHLVGTKEEAPDFYRYWEE